MKIKARENDIKMTIELKSKFLEYLTQNAKEIELDTEKMAQDLENIVLEYLSNNCPEGGCLI